MCPSLAEVKDKMNVSKKKDKMAKGKAYAELTLEASFGKGRCALLLLAAALSCLLS
jgi:hypothetical protein